MDLLQMQQQDKVLLDLKLLASIKPGQTLSTSTMTVIDHNTWSSSLWRRYKGETRNSTIVCITHILSQGKVLGLPLTDAIRGLENLKETYQTDPDIQDQLNELIGEYKFKPQLEEPSITSLITQAAEETVLAVTASAETVTKPVKKKDCF